MLHSSSRQRPDENNPESKPVLYGIRKPAQIESNLYLCPGSVNVPNAFYIPSVNEYNKDTSKSYNSHRIHTHLNEHVEEYLLNKCFFATMRYASLIQ